jgi:hypothetical protein
MRAMSELFDGYTKEDLGMRVTILVVASVYIGASYLIALKVE